MAWIPTYLILSDNCLAYKILDYLSRISLPVLCLHKYYISWQYTERQLWFWGVFVLFCFLQESEAIWHKAEESPIQGFWEIPRNTPQELTLQQLATVSGMSSTQAIWIKRKGSWQNTWRWEERKGQEMKQGSRLNTCRSISSVCLTKSHRPQGMLGPQNKS